MSEEVYEVEEVVNHTLNVGGASCKIKYTVKWVGYDWTNNTLSNTRDFHSLSSVVEYWERLLNSGRNLSKEEKTIASATKGLQEMMRETIAFFNDDNALLKFGSAMKTHNWWWIDFYSFRNDKGNEAYQELLKSYAKQVNEIGALYRNFPIIEVINVYDEQLPIPVDRIAFCADSPEHEAKTQKEYDDLREDCIPCRPPLQMDDESRLIFTKWALQENIDFHKKIVDEYDPYPSTTTKAELAAKEGVKPPRNDSFVRTMNYHPKRALVRLVRHEDHYWQLVAGETISAGTVITPLCGELCNGIIPEESLKTEGEAVALMHFIKLDERYQLDTRNRHGFDKYISHSCDPNCYFEYTFPYRLCTAKPYVTINAMQDIAKGEVLTVDWFLGFPKKEYTADVDACLNCVCGADVCRDLIWIEHPEEEAMTTKKNKKAKAKTPAPPERFCGIPLCTPNVDDRRPLRENTPEDSEDESDDEVEDRRAADTDDDDDEDEDEENVNPGGPPKAKISRLSIR